MKKRDLVLDFTSLLDVIMIILFVVVSSMGQASMDAREQAEKTVAEVQAEKDAVSAENEELTQQLSELEKENLELRAEAGRSDIDEAKMYEMLMKESDKVTMICTPRDVSEDTDKNETSKVDITIYAGDSAEGQEAMDTVTFTHDFSLNMDEREKANASMQKELYEALRQNVGHTDAKLILFTVEYVYDDKNFSQADLDNITGAINDFERELSITCYIDKIKK